jgi:hypothetical protein
MPNAFCGMVIANLPPHAGYRDILEHHVHLIIVDKRQGLLKARRVFLITI